MGASHISPARKASSRAVRKEPTDAITRPDGTAILFNRDYAGRIAEIQSATGNLVHSYNAATGDLDSVTAGSVTVYQEYASGFPIATRVTSPDFTGSVKWSFNRKMDVVTEQVTLGALQSLVTYRHDGDGLLTGDDNFIADRDPENGLVTETHLDAVSGYEAYNSFGELMGTSFSYGYGAPLYTVSYTRDGVGRVATKTENIEGTTWTYGYTYDTAGRLTAVDRNGQPFATYTYDPNGNRLSHTREGDIREGTYDGEDRVQTYGDYQYLHTANGELERKATLTAGGTWDYDYNAFGDLTRAALPDGRVIEYVVDGMQRRVAKKVNGAFVEGYLYKNELQIAADVGSNGELRNRYVYASGRRLPDYFIRAGEQYRILTDHLGSVRLVVNSLSGNVAQRIDYDEFGDVLYDSNPGFQPFGFAGGLYDADTGLVRFGARDYDPYTGRWTAKDPILFEGGDTNLYGYALNDPINLIDPSGLSSIVFDDVTNILTLFADDGSMLGSFPADNRTDRRSNGPWPAGTYSYERRTTHADDGPNSAYGSSGNFIFDVSEHGRTNMGVHSGRADRGGPSHWTMGCIRTTDQGTAALSKVQSGYYSERASACMAPDPLQHITVNR